MCVSCNVIVQNEISSALTASPGENGEQRLNDKVDDENDGGDFQKPGHAGSVRQPDRIQDDKNQQDRSGEKIDAAQNVFRKTRMERIANQHQGKQERMQQRQHA